MVESNIDDFELTRERFERLLKIPTDQRTEENLFELMRLTAQFKIFEAIKMSDIHREICRHMFSKTVERGEIIFKQGDDGDAFYFILRGCVDLYMYDIDQIDGKTKLKFLASLITGTGFGELALLYDCPRTATAIPNTKTDLVVIKKKTYTKFVKDLHERELIDMVKFYFSITIFKKEPISNIIKYCLRTNKKVLNPYEPFILIGDYLNEYCIIRSGCIKCYVRIKITNGLIKHCLKMKEDEFIKSLKELQSHPLTFRANPKEICKNAIDKDDMTSVYEEVLDIMEFGEREMYGEYYASKSKKIDVYLIPILPTEVITIKCDDLKKINPYLNDGIIKYSAPIFDMDRAFKKLYKNLVWKKTKSNLLLSVLKKK